MNIWLIVIIICAKKVITQEHGNEYNNGLLNVFSLDTWPGNYSSTDREILALWLLNGCINLSFEECRERNIRKNNTEYEGYDGWYNNIAKPDLGAIDKPLLRRWPAAYEDGSYEPSGSDRPNPMELSEKLLNLNRIGTKSNSGKSAFLVFFGQQIVEEILDAQRPACPPEYFNIEIPENHRLRNETNHTVLPFLRTRYDMRTGFSPNNPRQQLNEITPYFDGGLFYGTSKAWADYLRTNEDGQLEPDGLLASTSEEHIHGLFPALNKERLPMANPPPPVNHSAFIEQHEILKVERFFKLGNPRGNENTFLLSFGILWFRWHNYLARNLKTLNPTWSGEKVFNEARKWVIATHQHIVVNTWLPIWLGESLPAYRRYDPSIDPQIDQFFQAVAMRFGHTLVVPGVYLRDYGRNGCSTNFSAWPHRAVRTCNSYWRPQDAILRVINTENNEIMDIDRVLMGMASQPCEQEDHKIVEDLRGNVFGPLEFSRRDLMAINIQRARDHGLPDYNTARIAFGLQPIRFEEIDTHFSHVEVDIRNEFRRIYNLSAERMNVIDPWVGGLLETTRYGPGELFRTIIKDQFRRIRDGDRFWFENTANGYFTDEEIRRIKRLSIYDIVMAVTKMDHNDIPKNPFRTFRSLNEMSPNCTSNVNETTIDANIQYLHLPPLSAELLQENCTLPGTYDYFSNSEASYILTFTGISVFIIGTVVLVVWLSIRQQIDTDSRNKVQIDKKIRETFQMDNKFIVPFTAKEWVGPKQSHIPIVILLHIDKKQIQINTQTGTLIRAIDFNNTPNRIELYLIRDKQYVLIRKKNEYDLFLVFDTEFLRENFIQALNKFLSDLRIDKDTININFKAMCKQAITKKHRQKELDKFFRVIFAQAFKIKHSKTEISKVDSKSTSMIINTEITKTEFAESLSLTNDSEFVRRIFHLIDKDKNGFISFREFLDLLSLFSRGSPRDKAKLLFDMYDVNKVDYLFEDDLRNMIRSFLETCRTVVSPVELENTISDMLRNISKSNKTGLSFEDFYNAFRIDIERIGRININCNVKSRETYYEEAYDTIESLYGYVIYNYNGLWKNYDHESNFRTVYVINQKSMFLKRRTDFHNPNKEELESRIVGEISATTNQVGTEDLIDKEQEYEIRRSRRRKTLFYKYSRTIEKNFREIFWILLFTLVSIGIFSERVYYYSVEREFTGLRRIVGVGVAITRGAASGQMFTYSLLLLTMCRNLITILRETVLNNYIPFDRSVEMHKYIAYWALIFTLIHIIGHAFNFYSISTQTADDLTCLFRNYFHSSHELPKFHYWCWQTMTGMTGVIVTLICAIVYICALPCINRKIFWFGHGLYPLFYLFTFLHGTGRLVQAPYFLYFFSIPFILYIIDSIITASRKKIEIRVISAEILPSNVTKLEFKRPNNFEYKSGQWVRIACLGLNASEFHPFTLSSSPDEENLTVYIRAVGPWTRAIRQIYDQNILSTSPLPKIHLDGPYGEGHQDWYRYDVSVLIGGGIGVTPFASILKDIVFRVNKAHKVNCKKVYFIWVTKTQKQFEWLVDIIRNVEITDTTKTVSTHLFITQFYHKFDVRTTLLYICERYFQRVSGGRSLFTGLKAITHFGRPKFDRFFKSIQTIHPYVSNIGVFSCGPPPMTATVDRACLRINKLGAGSTFEHHYKNF